MHLNVTKRYYQLACTDLLRGGGVSMCGIVGRVAGGAPAFSALPASRAVAEGADRDATELVSGPIM